MQKRTGVQKNFMTKETLGLLTLVQMVAAMTMKTAQKVLHNKSRQALVHTKTDGQDEVKKLTEDEFRKMTKLRRKSWSVIELRWYHTLPNELHKMKPGTEGCKRRIDKWAKRMQNGAKIFHGMFDHR